MKGSLLNCLSVKVAGEIQQVKASKRQLIFAGTLFVLFCLFGTAFSKPLLNVSKQLVNNQVNVPVDDDHPPQDGLPQDGFPQAVQAAGAAVEIAEGYREKPVNRRAGELPSRGDVLRMPVKKQETGNSGFTLPPTPYDPIFQSASLKSGVDVRLLKAVAQVESGMNPQCVSHKGALGIMQLMPETAKLLGVSDPFDPGQNIHAGALYLSRQIRHFGSLDLALAAYNAGPNAVREYGGVPPFRETINYIARVKSYLE
ncbi:MAG: lytic transglycosylase domain-containing protein [Bacillota bacterium]